MTNVLNLDALVPATPGIIRLNGVDHEVREFTLETFLFVSSFMESLQTAGSVVKEIEMTVEAIPKIIPSLKREDLIKMNGKQLEALRNVIMRGGVTVSEEPESADEPEEGKPQPV